MFFTVHNLDPLPLDRHPNSQFTSLKHFANLIALSGSSQSFKHIKDSNVSDDNFDRRSSRILPSALKANFDVIVEDRGVSRSRVIMDSIGKKDAISIQNCNILKFCNCEGVTKSSRLVEQYLCNSLRLVSILEVIPLPLSNKR